MELKIRRKIFQEYWRKEFANIELSPLSDGNEISQRKRITGKFENVDRERIDEMCNADQLLIYNLFSSVFSFVLGQYTQSANAVWLSDLPADKQHLENVPVRLLRVVNAKTSENFKDLFTSNKTKLIENRENYDAETINLLLEENSGKINHLFQLSVGETNECQPALTDFQFVVNLNTNEVTLSIQGESNYHNRFLNFVDCYLLMLNQMINHPYAKLSDFDLVEAEWIRKTNNNALAEYPKEQTIAQRFKEISNQFPDRFALEFMERRYSYQQLDLISNQLASYVSGQKEVGVNDIIGIKLSNSDWTIIAILATLKLGCTYVPIDPLYPQERIQFLKESTSCVVVIDQDLIASFESEKENCSSTLTEKKIKSSSPAYVMYTSGSTGEPKGVIVTHQNVIQLIINDQSRFDFNELDTWTLFHSHCFDFSVWEIFGPLLTGGSVVVAPPQVRKDASAFIDFIVDKQVTVLNQTPSFFQTIPISEYDLKRNNKNLRYVIFGGEALNPQILERWLVECPEISFINMYGITETTVHVTYKEITENDLTAAISNIGQPLPTLKILLLNDHGKAVPNGVVGEISVLGHGVSSGYLNNPELTAEKFIPNPYDNTTILYKSGDLGRRLKSGEIEYIGRKDAQVKIRGHRIELGEIENALLSIQGLNRAIVLAKNIGNANALIAYLNNGIDLINVKEILATKLPAFMLPQHFVQVDEFPLTANGKIDKSDLLKIDFLKRKVKIDYEAPKTSLEKEFSILWSDELGVETVGLNDNFFNLGGDSIRALRVLSLMNEVSGVSLNVADIYKTPTIKGLINSKFDQTAENNQSENIQEVKDLFNRIDAIYSNSEVTAYPMSDIEKGMLFSSVADGKGAAYFDQFTFPLPFNIFNEQIFKDALLHVVNRHESLRCSYDLMTEPYPIRKVWKTPAINFQYHILNECSTVQAYAQINEFMSNERVNNPFDFNACGLWNMNMYELANKEFILLFQFHHAILDGWSVASLITELVNTYKKLASGAKLTLTPLKHTYKDYVFEELLAKQNTASIEFWQSELENYKRLDIFHAKDDFEQLSYTLDPKTDAEISEYCKEKNTTKKNVFFAAFTYALQVLTYDHDILIGLVSNGRPVLPDSDKVLGCFLNTVPFRFKGVSGTISDFVLEVDRKMANYKIHENLSLFELTQHFADDEPGQNPFFDIFYNYIDFHIYKNIDVQANEIKPNTDLEGLNFSKTNTFLDLNVSAFQKEVKLTLKRHKALKNGISLDELMRTCKDFINRLVNAPNKALNSNLFFQASEEVELASNTSHSFHSLLDRIKQKSEEYKNNTAVVCGKEEITYSQLDKLSNQLAHYMVEEKNIQKGDHVGISLSRSVWQIVSLLAVWKAEATFVPIDIQFPPERIDYIKNNADCKFVLTNDVLADIKPLLQNVKSSSLNVAIAPTHPAYVIYTSGTTGKPKGVVISHENLLDYVVGIQERVDFSDCHSFGIIASFAADSGYTSVFTSLVRGGELHIITEEVAMSASLAGNYKVDCLKIIPSHWIALQTKSTHFIPNKCLIFGGEALSKDKLEILKEANYVGRVYNHYGPTEATIGKLAKEIDLSNIAISLGTPIGDNKVEILNRYGQQMRDGSLGEICISGRGVSEGYYKADAITKEKFTANSPIAKEMLYRTGDFGVKLPNGEIQFEGRNDDQIKIRGNRVDVHEIQDVLLTHDTIQFAETLPIEDSNGEKEIVSFLKVSEAFNSAKLMDELALELPQYMIPSRLVVVENIPLALNGKVDRKKLLTQDHVDITTSVKFTPPRNEIEAELVAIWKTVLNKEQISVLDDFFALGGHSLKVIMLINLVNEKWKVNLRIEDLFSERTLENMAVLIQSINWMNNPDENQHDQIEIEI